MSKEEIKQEIVKTLDQFSETVLLDILSLIRQLPPKPAISLLSGGHLERLLNEDKELLQKLAQ